MNITTSMNANFFKFNYESMKNMQGTMKTKDIEEFDLFSLNISRIDFSFQSTSFSLANDLPFMEKISGMIDYKAIGYSGKPIEKLSQNEAQSLVSEDGFFGVKQTASRLSGFVLVGAGDDLEKLKEGRRGIIEGFEEAERIWGNRLFDISYETLEKALEQIDAKINELGGSVLNELA